MIAVSGKDPAHVFALECRPQVIRVEEFTIVPGGCITQLGMLFTVAFAAQPGGVVSGK
jgi:hypothetical protein